MTTCSRVALATTGCIAAFAWASGALAQASPAGAPQVPAPALTNDKTALSGLEDIIVTAQRRSENLQNVPISVTAVTSDTLINRGIVGTDSLSVAIPSLVITRQALGSTPYIRGVGSQSTVVGNENAVATYIDGIYIVDPTATALSFNNIERVEVLRGPQGTLFGRNATGGLINVITQTPNGDERVEGRLSYSNYDTVEGSAYATGGNERLAADIALYGIRQGESYGRYINIAGQPDSARQRKWAVRSKIVWHPSNADTLTLSGDFAHTSDDFGIARAAYPGSRQVGGYLGTGTIYDATGATPSQFFRNVNYGASLKYERNLGFADLTAITAYRDSDLRFLYDFDGTPARIVDLAQSQETDSFQNEVYLNGRTGRLEWTAGVFVFSTTGKAYPFAFRSISPTTNTDLFSEQQTKSYAAYAQGTYEIADQTRATLGLRYTIDNKTFFGRRLAAAGNPQPVGTQLQTAFSEVSNKAATWRIALDHKVDQDTLVYASYNRGYKSGAFNLANILSPPVQPERLDAYEVGVKTEVFDRLIRFNSAAFYYDYKNVQLTTTQVGITSLFNAASSTLKGLEAEATLAPRLVTGSLTFNVGLTLLDAKYNSFPAGQINTPNPAGGNVQTTGDLSGRQMLRAPKFTTTLGISASYPVGSIDLGFNANYYHNSGFPWEPDNRLRQAAYDIVNGDVSVSFGEQRQYRVVMWAKNLLDTRYFSYVTEGGTGDTGIAAAPSTFGVMFGFRL